jgi:hypothetical protein
MNVFQLKSFTKLSKDKILYICKKNYESSMAVNLREMVVA